MQLPADAACKERGAGVQNRLRMLMGATALLYLGPLLAGLGGFGWSIVPVFAAIFMLWLVIIRPQDFPQTGADWRRTGPLVAFGARGAVQLLLVLMCFGMGRGMGGVLGSLPAFPMMMPIAISFVAIPLARLIWDPWAAQAADQPPDAAPIRVNAGERAYAEAILAALDSLPDQVAEAQLKNHLSAIRALVDEDVIFSVLLARVAAQKASVAGRRALMVIASDGAALARMGRGDAPARAMQALGCDAPMIARMAERLHQALRADARLWHLYPKADDLAVFCDRMPEAADALTALQAMVLAQAAPQDAQRPLPVTTQSG